MNLGDVYLSLNKLDSALIFEQRASELYSKLPFHGRKYYGVTLTDIGNIYQRKGNFKLARDAFLKGEKVNKEHKNFTNLEYTYHSLGSLYITLKKSDSGLLYAMKALETAKSVRQPQYMAEAYKFLSDVYSYRKNNDSAFAYLKLATALQDSLNNVDRKNLLAYQNVGFDEQIRLKKLKEEKIQMQSKIRTNTLAGSLFTLIVIAFFLYRNNRQKQKAKQNIEKAYDQLKATQSQLIHAEKMASLGELTAGIAHEIQNPLNFVNNFSEVSTELLEEMKENIKKGNLNEVKDLLEDVIQNLEKIHTHGGRADGIIKSMLQHSRGSSGEKVPTDINALADEYLRLSYHGLRAKDKSFNADFKLEADKTLPKIEVVPQDIGRVLLNLVNNAFYAVSEKAKQNHDDYKPFVIVSTKNQGNNIEISVKDNGAGIPESVKEKIFEPFFTTKPTGVGTGLGLSLSYEIITKGHHGKLKVQSVEARSNDQAGKETGTEFIITIPIKS
jgi:signal transduction histidine kinase